MEGLSSTQVVSMLKEEAAFLTAVKAKLRERIHVLQVDEAIICSRIEKALQEAETLHVSNANVSDGNVSNPHVLDENASNLSILDARVPNLAPQQQCSVAPEDSALQQQAAVAPHGFVMEEEEEEEEDMNLMAAILEGEMLTESEEEQDEQMEEEEDEDEDDDVDIDASNKSKGVTS